MSKRYVYWRRPDGRPDRSNQTEYAPTAVLAEMGRIAGKNEQGQVTWPGFGFLIYELPVRCALVVLDPDGRELNGTDAWAICNRAITKIIQQQGGTSEIAPGTLIRYADKIAASHFRKSSREYVLLTSISIGKFPARRICVSSCEISALGHRSSRYPYPESLKSAARGTTYERHISSSRYQLVKVKTRGRTHHEGVERALDAMSLLRGLWTLFAGIPSWSKTFGIAKRPAMGLIHTGPIYTLHHLDGTLVGDIYWYEPQYVDDERIFQPKQGWQRIEGMRKRAIRLLRYLPYRDDFEKLLIRYVTALDHSDMTVAFLKLWSILEKVTNTVGTSYGRTIDRATWIYSDRQVAREMINGLRVRRNQFVHAAKSEHDGEQVAYMANSFVEPHLIRLLRNDFRVKSLAEYSEFLDLPTDPATLEKRRDHLSRAIRMAKASPT